MKLGLRVLEAQGKPAFHRTDLLAADDIGRFARENDALRFRRDAGAAGRRDDHGHRDHEPPYR